MADRSHIAVIVPGGIGAAENIPALLELIIRISRSFDVSLYSFSRTVPHPSLDAAGCSVASGPRFLPSGIATAIFLVWTILHDHRRKKFKAVHGFWILPQGLVATVIGKILRIPSFVTVPGGDGTYIPAIRYGGLASPLKRAVTRWCLRNARRVVALTQFQRKSMEAAGVAAHNLAIVPYGVDIDRFRFRPHGLPDRPRLLFIGNINLVKDPFTLLETFAIVRAKRNCVLTIVGSDILGGKIGEYARRLKVDGFIEWKGQIAHDAIPAEIHASDILLSTSRYEGESVAVMEAFACGIMVAGTRVGLLADIGDDSVTVPPGDSPGLAAIVDRLLSHPEEYHGRRIAYRKYAESHSAEWTSSRYMDLYRDELRLPADETIPLFNG